MTITKDSIIIGSKTVCSLFLILFLLLLPSIRANAQTLEQSETNMYEVLVDSADYYSKRKIWEKAEEMTVKALRLKPALKSNWLLWSNLGEIREQLGKDEEALTAYNIGLSINPASYKMRMGRAALLLQDGKSEEALIDLNLLIDNDSVAEWPRMIRGMIFLDKREDEKAEKDFLALKRINSSNTQALNGLAMINARKGKIKEAVNLYSESLKLKPDEDIYFYKVTLLADNEMLPEAADTLREAMKEFPRNGNLFLLRAYLHKLNYQQEEMEIAIKLAREYGADPHLIQSLFPNISSK